MLKLTKAEAKALAWIKAHQPVALFPADGPRLSTVKNLHISGLVKTVGVERGHGAFGFTQYAVSEAGDSHLSTLKGEKGE